MQGLDGLFEDRLHPRSPLVPQAPGDAHHRVGGAVAVREDTGVEKIDAGRTKIVGQVYQPDAIDQGFRDPLEQPVHQVGVGIDHDYGVAVPALGLLFHLVGHDVAHQRGLAHARAGHVQTWWRRLSRSSGK